jgi:hypothetical protein
VLRWWGVLAERAVGREGPKGRRMAAGKAGRFGRDPEAGNGTFVVCPGQVLTNRKPKPYDAKE